MSKRKVMYLPANCSINLGLEKAMGVTKSGPHQSSARLSSLKTGTVLLASVREAGPPWHGIEDEPTWGIVISSVQAAGR